MSYGPNPWAQAHWDARAAVNFIGGGAGAGLLAAAAAAAAGGQAGMAITAAALLGAALVGIGLFSVWLEIGRPWRALNVFRHPQRSWMSREAWVALVLLPAALATAAGLRGAAAVLLLAAPAYLLCQAQILRAARGIPAWREPLTVPLMVASGLAEGAALYGLVTLAVDARAGLTWPALAAFVLLRFALGVIWYRRLATVLRPVARSAVNAAGHMFNGGSLLALALLLGAWASPLAAPWGGPVLAAAAMAALVGGVGFKALLITRAAYNQGFALPRMPVRGVPRSLS